jgi:hypothetical protein
VELLEQNAQGFVTESWQTRLEQVAKLLADRQSWPAIVQAVHGDHREYMVRMRTLLQGLTHERWLERERAERALVEIGARARELLRDREQNAPTLEERDRVHRVLERIAERGTEEEDRRIKQLRGFVLTCLYLDDGAPLRAALVSALGHSDSTVVNYALRALGRHATDAEVPALVRQLESTGNPHRLTALCALARVQTPAARAALDRMLDAGQLNDVEVLHVMRLTRAQPSAPALLARLAASAKPLWREAAKLELPVAGGAPTCDASLSDRTALRSTFAGLVGDAVRLTEAVPGVAEFEAPFAAVALIQLQEVGKVAAPARVFLIQGSLLTGKLLAIEGDVVRLQSEVLGGVAIPRGEVQGILFAPEIDRLIGASPATDRIRLADNSLRDAEVVGFTPQGLLVRDAQHATVTLPPADVAGILFKRPAVTATDATQYSRLVLAGGDRVLGHIVGATVSHLAVVVPGPDDGPPIAAAVVPCSKIATLEFLVGGGASWGYTMIADYSDNRLVEVDENRREVFALEDVFGAWDVECLDNGNLLITEFSVSRVQEVTRAGKPVWAFEDLKNPYDADRLSNGNTLIADTFGSRVIEVDTSGKIVWQFAQDVRPFDCDRLANGNTLIADVLHDRVLEVTHDGQIAWELRNMKLAHDADRLPNGNTLITLREAKRVVEVDRDGAVVFELKNLSHPSDADRLPNGNTLVAENGMVREFDRSGTEIWRKEMTWAVEANRY